MADLIMDIIESIDGALNDYEVSPDAMRWSPDDRDRTPRRPNEAYGGPYGFEIDDILACRFQHCSHEPIE